MSHERFPEKMAFLLNNPVRRFLSPPQRLLSKLDLHPSNVVVDFGCGPGFYTIPLAKITSRVIGVDVSTHMLEKAASYAKRSGVTIETIQSDGARITLPDGSVDLILLNHVFHEVENRSKVLEEFLRTLKPSGRLAVLEKTRGKGVFSGKFGPPIMNEGDLVEEMRTAGFATVRIIPHGKDSVIVAKKKT
ncbi:MAG: class I SAM-dependent methyltransferase [Candidatus Bathyarchaeia archaeon]